MRFLFIPVLTLLCRFLTAQSEDKSELFSEGVYFFNRSEFTEAAYYFKRLADVDSNNCHYNFRLGECYMNTPGMEVLAVPYFEKAVIHTVAKKRYHYGDANEQEAPLHAWFYLGNVYRIAGRLNDALKAYDTFINSPYYEGNYNLNVVENEIKSCERAKIIMDSPVDVSIEPLDSFINTAASELNPVVTSDENTIVFVRRLKFYDAILMVTWQGNNWGTPVNLNPQIGSDGDFYPVSFSHDGSALFLMKNSGENKDLYVSYLKNNVWSKAKSLGKAINSSGNETWASLSSDGKTLWFTSSRRGGEGGLDIYYATLDKDNLWTRVKNAGRVINTPFDEESPCISGKDSILYFSSKGHSSMGGFDIFYAGRDGNGWHNPVNIGYPINNTSDNIGFIPVRGSSAGYYSFEDVRQNNAGDVYRISFKNVTFP